MPNCTFHIVDAFTAVPFTGNPCAVVTDADGIEPADMLRIARETNAPETAFVLASDKADVRVRYFMPRGEIPFAGHPTIATGHLLRELGVLKPASKLFWRPSAYRRRTCSPPKAWSLKRMCTPGLSIRTTPGKILSPDRPPGAWLPTCTRTGCVPGRASGLSRAISSTAREPGNWN